MGAVFDFDIQKRIGDDGEARFLMRFSQWERNNGDNKYAPDMKHRHRPGVFLDVKTDTHPMQNLWIETVSNTQRHTDGACLRALHDQCQFLAVYYMQPRTWLILNAAKTWETAQRLIATGQYHCFRIRNKHFESEGYALPIDDFRQAGCVVDESAFQQF